MKSLKLKINILQQQKITTTAGVSLKILIRDDNHKPKQTEVNMKATHADKHSQSHRNSNKKAKWKVVKYDFENVIIHMWNVGKIDLQHKIQTLAQRRMQAQTVWKTQTQAT